jgi:hypothetical protein
MLARVMAGWWNQFALTVFTRSSRETPVHVPIPRAVSNRREAAIVADREAPCYPGSGLADRLPPHMPTSWRGP